MDRKEMAIDPIHVSRNGSLTWPDWEHWLLFEVILFVFASAYIFQGIAWRHSGRELTAADSSIALTPKFSRQHGAVFLERGLAMLEQNASFSESSLFAQKLIYPDRPTGGSSTRQRSQERSDLSKILSYPGLVGRTGEGLSLLRSCSGSTRASDSLFSLSLRTIELDELIRECGLPTMTVTSTLMMMELKGMVKQVGSMQFVLGR